VPLAAAHHCDAAQSIVINVSVDDESVRRAGADSRRVGAVDGARLLTIVAMQKAHRRRATVSCSPARGAASRSPSSCSGREVFSPHDLADLEAEARLLGQLLHKNIVSASAAFRSSRRAAAS
jgi:hypothetical protein